MTQAKPAFDAKYSIAYKALNDRNVKTKHFDSIIPVIAAALDADEIISTKFAEVKTYCNRFVESAFKAAISEVYTYGGKYENQPTDIQFIDLPYEARNIETLVKRLDKLSPETKTCDMWKDTKALADELSNLGEVIEYLKAHTVKASVKRAQAKEEQETEKTEYNKKFTSHKDVKKVIELLKTTASNIEQGIYDKQLKSLHAIVNDYKDELANGHSDYTEIYKHNQYYLLVIRDLVELVPTTRYSKIRQFTLSPNWEEMISATAKRIASDIVDHFVYKNSGKLSYIIYTKNNMKSVEIANVSLGRSAVECDLIVKFDDGSSFIANSSVVLAYSKLGKRFYRYPTIFKNVILPNGKPLSGASEQKMDEEFAIAK